MRVLGIDPGSRHTGYGVVEISGSSLSLVACGTLSPGDRLPLAVRLAEIHRGLSDVLRRTRPAAVAVEDVFHAINARSALVLGQARGAALAAAAGVDVHEYAASEIKRAVTGSGRAQKEQVSRMVAMLLGVPVPGDEHACDALAAAICHLNRSRIVAGDRVPAKVEMRPAVVAPEPFRALVREGAPLAGAVRGSAAPAAGARTGAKAAAQAKPIGGEAGDAARARPALGGKAGGGRQAATGRGVAGFPAGVRLAPAVARPVGDGRRR